MPARKEPLVNGEYYHVYNRGINHQLTYTCKRDYKRFVLAAHYYQWKNALSLSVYRNAPEVQKLSLDQLRTNDNKRASIQAYCLMPNHFHFLLKQNDDCGIRDFISDLQNSYSKYFSIKHNHQGPIFLPRFKAKRVHSEQYFSTLIHYIHQNPLKSYLCQSKDLADYQWSSFFELSHNTPLLADHTLIKECNHMGDIPTIDETLIQDILFD